MLVFKRRDKKGWLRWSGDLLYPKGGWSRAFHYVKHRVHRLPDSPERIARGIWAGVFTTFTPFYGVHFVVAAILSRVMQGNLLAALMATFFGNPLTYVPIGLVSLKMGHWMMGAELSETEHRSFGGKFVDAGSDLKDNLMAMFAGREMDWTGLAAFYQEIFFPYLIGGIVPGILTATVCYYLSVPLIRAYQHRRKGRIKAKFDAIRKKAAAKADAKRKAD